MTLLIQPDNWLQIIFRLGLAFVIGCLIGWNRQRNGRPAGMRTFILVCMGSALFVMIPLMLEDDSSFATTNALSRTIQGVANGVGFLGAGLILQQANPRSRLPKVRVRGLTTAASIWMAAALGAVIGCGLWQLGVMGGLLTLLTLSSMKRLQRSVKVHMRRHKQSQSAQLNLPDSDELAE